jgi:hypothetical protein
MNAREYTDLIRSFLDGNLRVENFEARYLESFKAEPAGMDKQLFDILEDLFEDVDAYSPTCFPEEETATRISRQGLLREAAEALVRLDQYLLERPDNH